MNTKKIITDAAFSLFREFPFDAITVQMILNKAEVSRKTFYKHFKDKYELMELYYRRTMDQYIHNYYNGHNWYDILCFLHDFIEEERPYFKHVSAISGPDNFWTFLRQYSFQFYSSVKLHNEKREKLTEEERLTILMIIEPQPKAGEVLVSVKAVGLNPADYKLAQLSDASWEYPHILGLDLAGVAEEIGDGVADYKPGDRVCAHIDLAGQGCYAEYAVAPIYCVAPIPENVSFEEAAGMVSTGITAYQVVHRKVNLSNRKTALIHAGSGGVGSMAVQLAKEAGMTVYTTVPGNAIDFVRELGADVAINFEKEDFVEEIKKLTDGKGVDFILDPLFQAHVDQNIDLLAFNGDIVCLTTPPSPEMLNKLFFRGLGLHLVFVGAVHQSGNMQQMQDLSCMAQSMLSLISEGKVKVPVARSFPFAELPLALTTLGKEPPLGKFVVTVS